MFAPTFRGNGQASAHFPFEVLNLDLLYETLHEEYVFLFKIHPFVKNKLEIPYEYADFFYDFSEYREINDLLLVTDLLITDYSSVCFEFALLNKPMLFFAFDVEQYIEERDFYYNYFDFIPGPLIKTTREMVKTIVNKNFEMEKIPPFVRYFFDENLGEASKNVVEQVIIPSLQNKEEKMTKKKVILPPPNSRIELFERSIEEE
nr:CDP-glycerol glycerophosphotransferase family protein [Virgibacillus sp. SK37]